MPTPLAESRVVGRVSAAGDGAPLGRAAVFLESIDGRPASKPTAAAVMREQVGGFEPDFVVVAVGQPVEFVNDDEIFHGVFSYSRPNSFTRRPFPPGQSRTVSFQHPGVVRAYCPLHLTLPVVILVVPDAHYAVPDSRGDFQIGSVPAGRYRISLWTEQHGVAAQEISLDAGEEKRADLRLGEQR